MKNIRILLVVSIIAVSFSFMECSKDTMTVGRIDFDTVSFLPSMKGWELYSWPNGNDWNYSILGGTNRTKSYKEVTTNTFIVAGKDSLKMLLDKIPDNEFIFWAGTGWLENCWSGDYGNFSLPDSNTVNEIKEYCIQKKLNLTIND